METLGLGQSRARHSSPSLSAAQFGLESVSSCWPKQLQLWSIEFSKARLLELKCRDDSSQILEFSGRERERPRSKVPFGITRRRRSPLFRLQCLPRQNNPSLTTPHWESEGGQPGRGQTIFFFWLACRSQTSSQGFARFTRL